MLTQFVEIPKKYWRSLIVITIDVSMFKKISNLDVCNKLSALENKVDVLISNLEAKTLEGCCNCKKREVKVYKELMEYLNEMFCNVENEIFQKYCGHEIPTDAVKQIFDTFKKGLSYRLDSIISRMGSTIIDNGESLLSQSMDKVHTEMISINTKLDGLYYENEVIKHKLFLENELRKYEDDISTLKHAVNATIESVSKVIESMNLEEQNEKKLKSD